jgi:hAT family C-terminal dimerisation region
MLFVFCLDIKIYSKIIKSSVIRYDDPNLYQLSQDILAVPPTQISVERAFSDLGLILTSRRNRLADNTIENLLVCKLNPDVFDHN